MTTRPSQPPSQAPRRCHFFFLNDTAPPEIYTLSLHDALPIYRTAVADLQRLQAAAALAKRNADRAQADRKSTRLNSSHPSISYAVFCLKKKKKRNPRDARRADQRRSALRDERAHYAPTYEHHH